MTLLTTAAGIGDNKATTEAENMYAAEAALAKPKKVSARPVEPVPVKFDEEEANKMLSYAKSNAATGSVSGNSLVQNQLNNVLATDGPLLKRARTDGFASAAERGLNNSSIGVQAGEEAVIRQALQIATPDAQTYGEMDRANLASAANMAQTGVQQAFADYNQKKQNAFTASENNIDRNQKEDHFERANEFAATQQDKQNIFNSGENRYERDFRSSEQDKQNIFNSGENRTEREFRASEQDKLNIFNSGENRTEREFRASEQDKLNEFNVKRDETAQKYNLENIKAQTAGQIEAAASQLDDRVKGAYLDAASSLQRSYMEQQTAIYNNGAGKTDKQIANALTVTKQNFESGVSYLQGLYAQGGVSVDVSAFPAKSQAQPATTYSAYSTVPPQNEEDALRYYRENGKYTAQNAEDYYQ